MLNFVFIALIVIMVLVCIRFAVHYFWPGQGTTFAGMFGAIMTFLDMASGGLLSLLPEFAALPWDKIAGAETSKAIAFGFAITMVVLRKIPRKVGA